MKDPITARRPHRVLIVDDNRDAAAFVPALARARTADGRELREEVTALLGSPKWPLSEAEQGAKAADCLAFAGLPQCIEPLAAMVAGIEFTPDAAAAIRASGVIG